MTFKEYVLQNLRRNKWTYGVIGVMWFGFAGLFIFCYALREYEIWLKIIATISLGTLSCSPFIMLSWWWHRVMVKRLSAHPWKELFTSYNFGTTVAYEYTAKHYVEAPYRIIGNFPVTAVIWGTMNFQFHVQYMPIEKHEFKALEKEFKELNAGFWFQTIVKSYKRNTDLSPQQIYQQLEEFAALLTNRGFKPGDATKAIS